MRNFFIIFIILFPIQASAIVDQTPNLMGFYFDLNADTPCLEGAAPYSTHNMYLVLTNLQTDAIYGFEAGYTTVGEGLVLSVDFANPAPTDVGSAGNHIVGFGSPTLAGPDGVTLLATMSVLYMETSMGPLNFLLHGTVPSSIDPQYPVVFLEGGESIDVCCSSIAQINAGCGTNTLAVSCPDHLDPFTLPYFEDFNDGLADDFTPISGTWDVVGNEYRCLNQETGVKYVSVVGDDNWSDYRFSADIRTFGSLIEEMMVRYTPTGDWYLVTVRPEPYNQMFIHKFLNGVQTLLAQGTVPSHQSGTWHNLSIEVVGSEITGFFDGVEYLRYLDETDPIMTGKAGVVSFAYTDVEWQEAFFDNVIIEEFHGMENPQITINPNENDPISCDGTIQLGFDYIPAFNSPAVRGYSLRIIAGNAVTFSADDFIVNTLPSGEQVYYQIVENGENEFTLDYAILGQETQGITTPETLFTLTFHGSEDGVADVSIVAAELRDLENFSIPVEFSDLASIPVDCGPPEMVTDTLVEPGHESVTVTWTDPTNVDLVSILVYRGLWHDGALESVYPTYGQTTGNMQPTQFPEHDGYASSSEWQYVASVEPGVGLFVDEIQTRGIYFYQLFAGDPAGNLSLPLVDSPAATNYILGDVAVPYDGEITIADLSVLGASYGVSCGNQFYNAEVDIGPTEGASSNGIPIPDCLVGFEDIMIFSINFGSLAPVKTQPTEGGELSLAWVQNSGNEWSCLLTTPCPTLKGLHIISTGIDIANAQVLSGGLLSGQSGAVFFRQVDAQDLDLSIAVLGSGLGVEGTGELFRVKLNTPVEDFKITVEARSTANEVMSCTLTDHAEPALPTR